MCEPEGNSKFWVNFQIFLGSDKKATMGTTQPAQGDICSVLRSFALFSLTLFCPHFSLDILLFCIFPLSHFILFVLFKNHLPLFCHIFIPSFYSFLSSLPPSSFSLCPFSLMRHTECEANLSLDVAVAWEETHPRLWRLSTSILKDLGLALTWVM